MRLLSIALLATMTFSGSAFLTSCALEIEHTSSRRGHDNHHRGHHNHHYWNDAGEAYSEAASIRSLTVLPIKLPSSFINSDNERDEKKWRETWPVSGAQIIAALIISAPDIHVVSSPSQTKPTSGYYIEIEITQYDLGDITRSSEGTGTQGWSRLNAIGRIYNAETGKMVVDLAFDELTERYSAHPSYESQMSSIGQNLANWFREKQAGKS